jgi:integrase
MITPLFVSTKKRKVAVLTPRESLMIRSKLNRDYQELWDFLLYTRTRIAEAEYIADHPEAFREENRAIFLPNVEGLGKDRCTIKNRAITLCDKGVIAVKQFLENNGKIPTYSDKFGKKHIAYQNIEEVIRRAARDADFNLDSICTKMLRKTAISWYFASFPEQETMILMTAGHTATVARGHYITHGFRREDIKDMREELAGVEL